MLFVWFALIWKYKSQTEPNCTVLLKNSQTHPNLLQFFTVFRFSSVRLTVSYWTCLILKIHNNYYFVNQYEIIYLLIYLIHKVKRLNRRKDLASKKQGFNSFIGMGTINSCSTYELEEHNGKSFMVYTVYTLSRWDISRWSCG